MINKVDTGEQHFTESDETLLREFLLMAGKILEVFFGIYLIKKISFVYEYNI